MEMMLSKMKGIIDMIKYYLLIVFIIVLLFPYKYETATTRTATTTRSIITTESIPTLAPKSASTGSLVNIAANSLTNKETTNMKKSQSAPDLTDTGKSGTDFIDGLFPKRQFDLRVSADHDQEVGTDLVAEAIAKLWRSKSGNTQVEGTARVIHHTGPFSSQGNTKYHGSLNVHHEN